MSTDVDPLYAAFVSRASLAVSEKWGMGALHLGAAVVDDLWPDIEKLNQEVSVLYADVVEREVAIRKLEDKLALAQYDAGRCLEFQGHRDKVLRYWAKRALTAEHQLDEAGIERKIPDEG